DYADAVVDDSLSVILRQCLGGDLAGGGSHYVYFFFEGCDHHRDLHSFPTRRSSDLFLGKRYPMDYDKVPLIPFWAMLLLWLFPLDRKSTRLNSSHLVISYAVFCLKKKKTTASWRTGRAPCGASASHLPHTAVAGIRY